MVKSSHVRIQHPTSERACLMICSGHGTGTARDAVFISIMFCINTLLRFLRGTVRREMRHVMAVACRSRDDSRSLRSCQNHMMEVWGLVDIAEDPSREISR